MVSYIGNHSIVLLRDSDMPNWCNNVLTITHDNPDKIREAKQAFEEQRLLAYFCPEPQWESDESDQWYDWRIANWGTKWDVGELQGIVEEDIHSVTFRFDSAWSPPTEAYKIARRSHGFEIEAFYIEIGDNVCGQFVLSANVIVDTTFSLEASKSVFRSVAPRDYRDIFPDDFEMLDAADEKATEEGDEFVRSPVEHVLNA